MTKNAIIISDDATRNRICRKCSTPLTEFFSMDYTNCTLTEMVDHYVDMIVRLHPTSILSILQKHGLKWKIKLKDLNHKRYSAHYLLGNCYHNSFVVVKQSQSNKKRKLLYCEGIAVISNLPLPVTHAWALNPSKNEIIDVTWKNLLPQNDPLTEILYFGLPLAWNFVKQLKSESYLSVFIDPYKILRNIPSNNLIDFYYPHIINLKNNHRLANIKQLNFS